MRKIPVKNYVILAIIFIMTIGLVWILKDRYQDKQKYENKTNERLNILYEIKEDDLKSYLVENRDIVIYMSQASSKEVASFETEFKNYIAKNEITKDIVYLNLDQVSTNFYQTFKDQYFVDHLKNVTLYEQPNLIEIDDGKATNVLYREKKAISMNEVSNFIHASILVEE